ncbi:hypothetical protein FAM18108_03005 [Lacticaseibacillus paracasei]|nr:hypothetical protein FAM18108_03005 [Lacticaseibacillus paracasei]
MSNTLLTDQFRSIRENMILRMKTNILARNNIATNFNTTSSSKKSIFRKTSILPDSDAFPNFL